MPRYINGHLQKVKSTSLQEIEPQSSDCFLPYATLFHPLYRNITRLSRSIINVSHNHFIYIYFVEYIQLKFEFVRWLEKTEYTISGNMVLKDSPIFHK